MMSCKIKTIELIFSLCILLMIFSCASSQQVSDERPSFKYDINGIWKLDVAMTVKSRIMKGVPWHIGDRFGMGEGLRIIREFDHGKFRFYDEKTGNIIDIGTVQIIESKKNRILLRILPSDNRYNINDYRVEELVRLSRRPGENVPGIIGLKFIDKNIVESFSYVKDFGKDKIIVKDDNAYWKRITEIPKQAIENSK